MTGAKSTGAIGGLHGLRMVMRIAMSTFYLVAGYLHLTAPQGFVLIVPNYIPWPESIVFLTGLCEILGAVGLMIPATRRASGIGLAAYAVCVFPANINHALNMIPIGGLPSSWWYHGPRLAAQPLIVWWALFAGDVFSWPFRQSQRRASSLATESPPQTNRPPEQ